MPAASAYLFDAATGDLVQTSNKPTPALALRSAVDFERSASVPCFSGWR